MAVPMGMLTATGVGIMLLVFLLGMVFLYLSLWLAVSIGRLVTHRRYRRYRMERQDWRGRASKER